MPTYPPAPPGGGVVPDNLGDLLTDTWQIELRETLFAVDCDGPHVVVEFLDGFGVPATRDADEPRPQQHGLFASPQFLGGRSMTTGIAALADTYAELIAAKEALGGAWKPVNEVVDGAKVVPLVFTLGDAATSYLVWGKPQRAVWDYAKLLRLQPEVQYADAALCEFLAVDPRLYSLDLLTDSATPSTSSGGFSFPLGPFPFAFGSASPGSITANNAGNIESYPAITVEAITDLSGITLTNVTTGESWSITLTVAAGDFLVVDMGERTVYLSGTASRSSLVNRPGSDWWAVQPGDNTLQFSASGDGTATFAWRSAWLI